MQSKHINWIILYGIVILILWSEKIRTVKMIRTKILCHIKNEEFKSWEYYKSRKVIRKLDLCLVLILKINTIIRSYY